MSERRPDPAEAAAGLRNLALMIDPAQVGIEPSKANPRVWGVLMELGMGEAVVTLVSLADGTTSMYFSTGGGYLGSGEDPDAARASKDLVLKAEKSLDHIPEAATCPQPRPGNVSFHVLTFDGHRSIEAAEAEIRDRRHPLFSLYGYGQNVITQVRLLHERKQASRT
ncbi:MAG: hypothetical protein JXB85_12465 [Anaerolineales bacterium]|nr:hypothetical protein [Anaerolineales bacterium]